MYEKNALNQRNGAEKLFATSFEHNVTVKSCCYRKNI